MTPTTQNTRDPNSGDWPILVTGAGGFVGGHIARHLAESGHHVRGLSRSQQVVHPHDPPIEWLIGDVCDPHTRRAAVSGMRGIIHTAAWVSLGRDREGLSHTINVEATRSLLDEARQAGVERFVHTSTLHTLAAGTRQQPADEETPWNLETVDSPYCRTKREAEAIVRQASTANFSTVILCPGMVLGPRDPKPTSTRLIRTMAKTPIAVVPDGGIPIVDSRVIALAHRRALASGEAGERYAIVGEYLTYVELARLVAQISGNPRRTVTTPGFVQAPMKAMATIIERLGIAKEISATTVAGGYLHLHVSGRKADSCFGLTHPPALETIRHALARDHDPSQ